MQIECIIFNYTNLALHIACKIDRVVVQLAIPNSYIKLLLLLLLLLHLSKKSWPNLYSNSIYKMGQNILDLQSKVYFYEFSVQKSARKRSNGPFDLLDNSDESETSSLCSEKSFDYGRPRPSDVSLDVLFVHFVLGFSSGMRIRNCYPRIRNRKSKKKILDPDPT